MHSGNPSTGTRGIGSDHTFGTKKVKENTLDYSMYAYQIKSVSMEISDKPFKIIKRHPNGKMTTYARSIEIRINQIALIIITLIILVDRDKTSKKSNCLNRIFQSDTVIFNINRNSDVKAASKEIISERLLGPNQRTLLFIPEQYQPVED